MVRRATALELFLDMDFGIDSVILESGIHRTPIFAAHRAKRTNTVPGITSCLQVLLSTAIPSIRQNQSPITVDASEPEHPAKLINLSTLIGRDARCSLLVCAVRERFRLVSYRSFDIDCFIGIHGILLPSGQSNPHTKSGTRFKLWPDDGNCLKHRQIGISCNFSFVLLGKAKDSRPVSEEFGVCPIG
jgi:hypothetical protein